MKFCDKCGSYMHRVPGGFSCPRCGNENHDQVIEVLSVQRRDSSPVEVVDESEFEHVKVKETCPQCGNREAFRVVSFVSGEHAGVRQERSIERFKCTKCLHRWSKS